MTRSSSPNWVTGVLLAAVSTLALGCAQSSETQIFAERPETSPAEAATAVTVDQIPDVSSTTIAESDETTPPTYRTDVTEVAPPDSPEADSVSFSSRIVMDPSDDATILLETQFLSAPDGTELVEIVVNGWIRSGSSYAPGVVGVLPLHDETEVEVEVRAYDTDENLLATATLDHMATTEEN